MADDDLDDDEDNDEEAKAIAESRHLFAASSSSSQLRHSPYLSSTTSRGGAEAESIDNMGSTFSPQPSSSSSSAGLNPNYHFIPTTSSSVSSA